MKTIAPLAAPGEAPTPCAIGSNSKAGSKVGCSSASSAPASMFASASSRVDEALADHVDRHPHRGLRGPLGVAGLKHVEGAFLDRELDVLHVAVVALERPRGSPSAARAPPASASASSARSRRVARARTRRPRPGRSGRKSPLGCGSPVRSSRENATPEPDVVALVAEHHLLHVDRGAPVVGDPVQAPVGDGAVAVPGVEHRLDRLAQLLARVLGELLAGVRLEDPLELGDERPRGRPRRARCRASRRAPALRSAIASSNARAVDAAHDVAEHLHEAPVRVGGEALVPGARGEARDRLVVQAEVEDGVEHARHRLARARAHRDEQRVLRVAEPLAGAATRAGRAPRRPARSRPAGRSAVAHVGDAGRGRDREAGGHAHRAADARHLGDVGALAAEQLAHLARALREVVDPFLHWRAGGRSARRRCAAARGHGIRASR